MNVAKKTLSPTFSQQLKISFFSRVHLSLHILKAYEKSDIKLLYAIAAVPAAITAGTPEKFFIVACLFALKWTQLTVMQQWTLAILGECPCRFSQCKKDIEL